MNGLLLLALTAFAVCLCLTPLARALAAHLGLVDKPDGGRKLHGRAIPLAGGIAILCTLILVLAGTGTSVLGESLGSVPDEQFLLGLLLACLVLAGLGIADDFGRLRGRQKLLGQLLAIALVIHFGVRLESIQIFGWTADLGLLGWPLTAALLLGAINSLNLIDGMDGLLGTVGVLLSLTLAIVAFQGGDVSGLVVALTLAGALLGFLVYNFPPASLFLGDCGSMLIGLVIGVLAIRCPAAATGTLPLAIPLALLTLPFFDTTAAIVRRKLTGRSLYTTDRGHLHHCLLRRGFSPCRVLLLVAFLTALTGVGVVAGFVLHDDWLPLLSAGAVLSILITTRLFGFAEVMLIKERLRGLLHRGVHDRQIEVRLQGSADWKALWETLTISANQLNLQQVLLDVNAPAWHEGYHARWDRPAVATEESALWRAEIPLTAQGLKIGRLEISGPPDTEPVWVKIASVTRVVQEFETPLVSLFCGCFAAPLADGADSTIIEGASSAPTLELPATTVLTPAIRPVEMIS